VFENGVFLLQLSVGGVFLLAAAAKLLHLSEFTAAVQAFGVVPAQALRPVSAAIPLLELLCGTLLITGLAAVWGVWVGMGLVVVFIVVSSVALAQGRGGIDCYCFGAGGQPLGKATLTKQVVILALLVLLAPTAGSAWLQENGITADMSGVAGVLLFVFGAWAIAFVAAELLRLRTISQLR
jgi:uncharacterized membrane protein YphA (DoxX/SURF4 family)